MEQIMQVKNKQDACVFVDGTFGEGHYSRRLLDTFPKSQVIAMDRDPEAYSRAKELEKEYPNRLIPVFGKFGNAVQHVHALGLQDASIDCMVMDVGLSSNQLASAQRGFSFMRDGPLDMRMSNDQIEGQDDFDTTLTAEDIINEYRPDDIFGIIKTLGEENSARRYTAAIIKARAIRPITTTRQLADIIEKASTPRRGFDKLYNIHPATKTFQALRIYINDELRELQRGIMAAERLIKPGGLCSVVTFHSLEDRLVKNMFKRTTENIFLKKFAEKQGVEGQKEATFNYYKTRFTLPTQEEMDRNPRSRSAKLRTCIRTEHPPLLTEEISETLYGEYEKRYIKKWKLNK